MNIEPFARVWLTGYDVLVFKSDPGEVDLKPYLAGSLALLFVATSVEIGLETAGVPGADFVGMVLFILLLPAVIGAAHDFTAPSTQGGGSR